VNKKINKNDPGVSIKTKKSKIDNDNNINFSNSKIEFMSVNINLDVIDIFLLHNSKKILSQDSSPNYYRLIAKDIGVKDSFQDIVCKIVNDIEVTISIKFKNKFSSGSMSIKDRLKIFNQGISAQKKPNENQYIPKKRPLPNFLQKNAQTIQNPPIEKKIEEPKKESPKIEQEPKKESPKIEQEPKKESPKIEQEPKKENPKIEQEPKKEIPNIDNKEEIKKDGENKEIDTNKKKEEKNIEINKENKEEKVTIEDKEKKEVKENKIEEKQNQKEPEEKSKEIKKNEDKEEINNNKPEKFEKINAKSLKKTKTLQIGGNKPVEKKGTFSLKSNDDFVVLDMISEKNKEDSNEIFLEPKKYSEYLDEQHKKNIKHPYRETFCEGFFIASFPKKDAKVIEIDTLFMAQCQHEECSKLPGMKPEIIFRYPLKDTKTLELNNLAATICFPTGIKVCYNENDEPKGIKDYVTSITNQKGERYYMMTYHFYLKMDAVDYSNQYEKNPLKYNLFKFADAYTGLSEEELTEEMINEVQNNLEWNQELANREIVYIPYCICLISKYPYVHEMKSCLKSIYTILNNENQATPDFIINDIIMYLINSIPIPAKNTKVKFLMPYSNNYIDLDCPKLDDINIMNLSASKLLKYFTVDNLIIIFKLLITEKKILLIDNDYEKLSAVADGLVSILYPLQWVHTYIPIMSDQMLKYLETFLPFLNGINESLMSSVEKVFTEGEVEEDDEVFLIYIKENKIKLSSSLRGKAKKFEKYIQDNIPSLPSSLEKELKNKLKKAKSRLDEIQKYKKEDTIKNWRNLELQIRDAFIDIFVEMFQDYAKYLSFVDQDAVFNKALFLEKKSNNEKKFYNEIVDTQLFQQFTQNVVNEDVGYFNKKIALKELGRQSVPKKQNKSEKIEKEYMINPGFLNLEQNFETDFESLVNELKEKYPENTKLNSVLITEIIFNIKDEDYNEKNCDIYFTKEELEQKVEKAIVDTANSAKNPRKMTNNLILQRLKELNLKSHSLKNAKKEEMSEKEKENIKEYIKDTVIQIFKSEEVTLDQKNRNELLNKLNLPIGREFFISLLSKNDINIILLNEKSLTLLWTLIYNSLLDILKLEETDKILEQTALLIKSTKYFGIQENNQTVTLFDKNIVKFQDLPKIRQENFWQKWYDIELKKNEKNKDDVEFKQNIMYDICKTLIQLELPKTMVKNFTDSINVKEFGKGSELQVATFKTFIKFIQSANYISKAF